MFTGIGGFIYIVCGGVLIGVAAGCAAPSFSVVTVPVADVRAKPEPSAAGGALHGARHSLGRQPSGCRHFLAGADLTGSVASEDGAGSVGGAHDPLQETQLLYGERVKVLNTDGDWAFIEAVEQAEYTHANAWQGYPGWVRQDALRPLLTSITPEAVVSVKWAMLWADAPASTALMQVPLGTKLTLAQTEGPMWPLRLIDGREAWLSRGDVRLLEELRRLPVEHRRRVVVRAAEQFLGDPYFWGGRSPHQASGTTLVTGVDCSGLVNLAYRTAGIDIPRDAHEQYLRARKITTLHPADMIFLSEAGNAKNIVHIMLYAGDGWLLEGPGTGLSIRRIEATERFGRCIHQLKSGERIDRQTLFFGAYLP